MVIIHSVSLNAEQLKVLFIGNSYTSSNNLPQLVSSIANSCGDQLIYQSHIPGGARFLNHAVNSQVSTKINSDTWDYVVLQAQSQEPSWGIEQVEEEVFPFAKQLCQQIKEANSCTRPVFFMTWGRKDGDQLNCHILPSVCTYEGMDALLNERYRFMAKDNESYVSPVGAVWNYLRNNHPEIELYSSDGSHPSLSGSYAAACTFYTVLFQKDPSLITYDSSVSESNAEIIRNAVKVVAFDQLMECNVGIYDPISIFTSEQKDNKIQFTNKSQYADTYQWNFGDMLSSDEINPLHAYSSYKTYNVSLTASRCGKISEVIESVTIEVSTDINQSFSENELIVFPNPAQSLIYLKGSWFGKQVTFVNAVGNEFKMQVIANNKIDISNLSSGIYLLKIKLNEEGVIMVKKIIKK